MDRVYQHFRKNEAPFIDQLEALIATAASEYRPVLTDFLDPRQRYIASTLVGAQSTVALHHFGGYLTAERQRVVFAPTYFAPLEADYELALLQIKYPEKFAELHHSTILGTLVNSGIRRALFGDIVTANGIWQVVVAASMSAWVQNNVQKIGKVAVRLTPVALDTVVTPQADWEATQVTLTSLRLDAVVAHVFNLSRQRAKGLIEGERVQLNFGIEKRPDMEVAPHDIVSVRGYGRLRLGELLGVTRKDKTRVTVDVLHK